MLLIMNRFFFQTYNLNFSPKKIKSENLYLNGGFENQLNPGGRFTCWKKDKPPATIDTIHSFAQPGNSNSCNQICFLMIFVG